MRSSGVRRTPVVLAQTRILSAVVGRLGVDKALGGSLSALYGRVLDDLRARSGTPTSDGEADAEDFDLIQALGGAWLLCAVVFGLVGLLVWVGLCISPGLVLTSLSKYGLVQLWRRSAFVLDALWGVFAVLGAVGMSAALLI